MLSFSPANKYGCPPICSAYSIKSIVALDLILKFSCLSVPFDPTKTTNSEDISTRLLLVCLGVNIFLKLYPHESKAFIPMSISLPLTLIRQI